VKALFVSFRSRPVIHQRREPNQMPPKSGTDLCLVSGLLNLVRKLEVPLLFPGNVALVNTGLKKRVIIIRELETQGMMFREIVRSRTDMSTCNLLFLHKSVRTSPPCSMVRTHQPIDE
jgi:hypothetical protein